MLSIAKGDFPLEEWRAGVMTRMLISARNGAAQLCIFQQWVDPGAGAPTHVHTVEEVLSVLSGEAEMWVGDEHTMLAAGESLLVPAERRHGFRNIGSATLHVQATLAAPIFEATFDGRPGLIRRWLAESAS